MRVSAGLDLRAMSAAMYATSDRPMPLPRTAAVLLARWNRLNSLLAVRDGRLSATSMKGAPAPVITVVSGNDPVT